MAIVVAGSQVFSKAFLIESPTAADNWPFWRAWTTITLVEVDYLCIGGTNWVGQVQEGDANGANPVDTQAADTTANAGTNAKVTSFVNADIDAGDYVILKTTSVTGVPTGILVTICYREGG